MVLERDARMSDRRSAYDIVRVHRRDSELTIWFWVSS
jgi:hypothetical protein